MNHSRLGLSDSKHFLEQPYKVSVPLIKTFIAGLLPLYSWRLVGVMLLLVIPWWKSESSFCFVLALWPSLSLICTFFVLWVCDIIPLQQVSAKFCFFLCVCAFCGALIKHYSAPAAFSPRESLGMISRLGCAGAAHSSGFRSFLFPSPSTLSSPCLCTSFFWTVFFAWLLMMESEQHFKHFIVSTWHCCLTARQSWGVFLCLHLLQNAWTDSLMDSHWNQHKIQLK